MRVLVTDGDTRAALAVTRALGRRGHEVWVGDSRDRALAKASRYCRERLTYADPVGDQERFIDDLERTVRGRRIDMLLPVTDLSTVIVSHSRDRFHALCHLPIASREAIDHATDKVRLLDLARAIGVAVPATVVLPAADAVLPRDAMPLPIVVKARKSRIRHEGRWMECPVRYATSHHDVARAVSAIPPDGYPVILQERIEGPGIGIFLCFRDGQIVARFSHRRLRERPPSGGVSVLCESVPLPPIALDFAERLLRSLEWNGVAMVEFKHDNRDGLPKLMEINPRFWGSLQLAIDAGVDFPGVLVDGGAADPEYRTGLRSRWFWGDVDALLLRLFNSTVVLPPGAPSRARAMVEFVKLWQRDVYYDNPARDDVRPWFYESEQWLRRLGGAR